MSRKPMSLKLLYDELIEIPAHTGWETLLRLIGWQLRQGQTVGRSLGYYARLIILDYRRDQTRQKEKLAHLRCPSGPVAVSALLNQAMEPHGVKMKKGTNLVG